MAASLLVGAPATTAEVPAVSPSRRDSHHSAARLQVEITANSSSAWLPRRESWPPRSSRPARLTPISSRIT